MDMPEVILERFWPRDFPVTPSPKFWLENNTAIIRWKELKQTIAAIETMRDALEEFSVYAINESPNPLQDVVDKMNKFIDYEPDTDIIDPFPENAVMPTPSFSRQMDFINNYGNRYFTYLPHGPLYEYYMGALPDKSDFADESAYYKMYGNN
jgi:hypothetical protein